MKIFFFIFSSVTLFFFAILICGYFFEFIIHLSSIKSVFINSLAEVSHVERSFAFNLSAIPVLVGLVMFAFDLKKINSVWIIVFMMIGFVISFCLLDIAISKSLATEASVSAGLTIRLDSIHISSMTGMGLITGAFIGGWLIRVFSSLRSNRTP